MRCQRDRVNIPAITHASACQSGMAACALQRTARLGCECCWRGWCRHRRLSSLQCHCQSRCLQAAPRHSEVRRAARVCPRLACAGGESGRLSVGARARRHGPDSERVALEGFDTPPRLDRPLPPRSACRASGSAASDSAGRADGTQAQSPALGEKADLRAFSAFLLGPPNPSAPPPASRGASAGPTSPSAHLSESASTVRGAVRSPFASATARGSAAAPYSAAQRARVTCNRLRARNDAENLPDERVGVVLVLPTRHGYDGLSGSTLCVFYAWHESPPHSFPE